MPLSEALQFILKDWLGRWPSLYIGLLRLKRRGHWSRDWLVNPSSPVVIEGFPRCGNSFAHSAFRRANPEVGPIATHVHHEAQVILACRWQRPCLVLVREPAPAVISLGALTVADALSHGRPAPGRLPWHGYLNAYNRFYRTLLPYRKSLVIAPFEVATRRIDACVQALNDRFGTHFTLPSPDRQTQDAIFSEAGHHLSPNRERDRIKQELAEQLQADPHNHDRLAACRETYETFRENALALPDASSPTDQA
ncbi:MAG: hypothetical protein ACFE0O_02565 [Opitutales bacterium]